MNTPPLDIAKKKIALLVMLGITVTFIVKSGKKETYNIRRPRPGEVEEQLKEFNKGVGWGDVSSGYMAGWQDPKNKEIVLLNVGDKRSRLHALMHELGHAINETQIPVLPPMEYLLQVDKEGKDLRDVIIEYTTLFGEMVAEYHVLKQNNDPVTKEKVRWSLKDLAGTAAARGYNFELMLKAAAYRSGSNEFVTPTVSREDFERVGELVKRMESGDPDLPIFENILALVRNEKD